jgi:molecular chaperone IbpA
MSVVVASKGGWLWRHSSFPPLFRSTIGFDQLPSLLSHAMERPETGFPPYNIEKAGEDQYRIDMAVTGFTKDQIEIVQEPNCLIVRGKLKEQPGKTYLHRGIANGAFERHFELADYVEVTDATMGQSLLVVNLKARGAGGAEAEEHSDQ